MNHIKQTDVVCPECGCREVHLGLRLQALNDPEHASLPGAQLKFSLKLAEVPVLFCRGKKVVQVSEGDADRSSTWLEGYLCKWELVGHVDPEDGQAMFIYPETEVK